MPLIRPPPPPSNPTTTTSSSTKPIIPPFATCTRTTYQPNLPDWFQITDIPEIDICPDCYNTSLKPTSYSRFISPAPPKPDTLSTRCDFGDLWIRIAWAWLYIQSYPDLSLLGQIARIQHPEGACPNLDAENEDVKKGGKPPANRVWYCLQDPKSGDLVEDMTICGHCVAHIYTITPSLDGIFLPAANNEPVLATCDLMLPKQDRTLKYIDQILEVGEKMLDTGRARDVTPLVTYIRKWAPIPPCPKWERVQGQKCYSMISAAPEWKVCEECYITHVEPIIHPPPTAPSSLFTPRPLLLSQITTTPSIPSSGFTCQMYSPRLQEYFKDVLSSNNLSDFRRKLGERERKLVETKRELERLKGQWEVLQMQADYHYQMMSINQTSAWTSRLGYVGTGWVAPPTDYTLADASMNRAGEANVQAEIMRLNMTAIEKEWADLWE